MIVKKIIFTWPLLITTPLIYTAHKNVDQFIATLENLTALNQDNQIIDDALQAKITLNDVPAHLKEKFKDYLSFKLLRSIQEFDFDTVQFLLQHNADPNVISNDPQLIKTSALQTALNLNPLTKRTEDIRRHIIIELLKAGADPFPVYVYETDNPRYKKQLPAEVQDPDNAFQYYNLFTLPNVIQNQELAIFLVQAAREYTWPEYKNNFQKTLKNSVDCFHSNNIFLNIIGNILMSGIDINLQNNNQENILHLFFTEPIFLVEPRNSNNDQKLLIFLLKLGANPNTPNIHGQTSLHMAVLNSDKRFILTLLKYGADPLLTDKNNLKPRNVAHQLLLQSEQQYHDDEQLVLMRCLPLDQKLEILATDKKRIQSLIKILTILQDAEKDRATLNTIQEWNRAARLTKMSDPLAKDLAKSVNPAVSVRIHDMLLNLPK